MLHGTGIATLRHRNIRWRAGSRTEAVFGQRYATIEFGNGTPLLIHQEEAFVRAEHVFPTAICADEQRTVTNVERLSRTADIDDGKARTAGINAPMRQR